MHVAGSTSSPIAKLGKDPTIARILEYASSVPHESRMLGLRLATQCPKTRSPLEAPRMKSKLYGYCEECRKPVALTGAVGASHAWCSNCDAVVSVVGFRMKAWILGAVLVIFSNFLFQLWV